MKISGHRDSASDRPSQKQECSTDEEPTSLAPDTTEYPAGLRFWLIILTIAAVILLSALDINIVATAVPSITDHFHTVADVGWYISAFRLCACAFQLIFGKSYKLFSVKRVFMVANISSMIGSLLCGTASSSTMLVVGRAVAGIGCAGLLSGCFVVLISTMPLHRRPLFVGILGGIESVAQLAGPLLGGLMTDTLGWRWCFYINLPIGCLTLLLNFFCLHDDAKPVEGGNLTFWQKTARLDWASNLLFVSALTSLFIALSWAGTTYSWASGEVIGPLVTFAFLMAAFLYNQIRLEDDAVLPIRILRKRSVVAGFIFSLCTNGVINVLEYYLPTYFQTIRGYSAAKSGFMLLPVLIGAAVGTMINGAATTACGYYAPFMLVSSLTMPVAVGLTTTFTVDTSLAKMILSIAFVGFANGIGFSGPQTAVQAVLPKEDAGLGLSVMLFSQNFGPALFISVAQLIFVDLLAKNLDGLLPGLTPATILNNGLADIGAEAATQGKSDAVLVKMNKSLVHSWYLAVGLACATLCGSLLIEWRSIKPKAEPTLAEDLANFSSPAMFEKEGLC